MLGAREAPQRAHEQQVLLPRGILVGEPIGRLDHRRRRRVGAVVGHDHRGVGAERHRLRDDVEAAADGQLQVGDHERLEPPAEPRRGAPHALRDRAHLAVLAREQRDDAVGLAQLMGAEDDPFVAVRGHR